MEKLARAGNEVILTSHFAATAQITFQRSLNLIGIPTYFHKALLKRQMYKRADSEKANECREKTN